MDIQKLLKQAEKMQKDAEKLEQELVSKTYEATVGGGAVTVVVTGNHQVDSITVNDDELLEDKEMLLDLITLALNQAFSEANDDYANNMGDLTKGLSLPGGF